MLDHLKSEANLTETENGAVTYMSTGSDCLDFFATAGAIRREPDEEIIARFIRAYTEDRVSAMKLLFFTRDVRNGLGERQVFRTVLRWLADSEPASVRKNIRYIPEFGRYDDLLCLLGTACESDMLEFVREKFYEDMRNLRDGGEVSLLGKWLPSVNTSSEETVACAKKIARALGLDSAGYRKALSALRARIDIIENRLREKDYTFDYARQPSRAMFKYRAAFMRNDRERYTAFLEDVASGKTVLHAGNVAPYELVQPFINDRFYGEGGFMRAISEDEKLTLNTTWESFPDYGGSGNALAVIDTSGSMYEDMYPMPAAVALSLGLYFAEHNKGEFAGHFIEFSRDPQLIEIKGETFADRLRYAASFNQAANTDMEAVFELVLNAAVRNSVPQEELPERLIIISDMEFDSCVDNADQTVFENAAERYASYGYRLPQLVFWNVASRHRNQPVSGNEQGVILVSGATPILFSMVAEGSATPHEFMMQVLNSERYSCITA